MIETERGYYFQDYVSAYLVVNYMDIYLKENRDIFVVFDKKENSNDKFDDIKINCSNLKENYQIKYREKKVMLSYGDFFNKSGDFDLNKFILSNSGNKCRLFIGMNGSSIDDDLSKYLTLVDGDNIFSNSKVFKFKNLSNCVKKLNAKRDNKIDIDDIVLFENNFILEVCDINLSNVSLVVSKNIRDLIGNLSNDSDSKLLRILMDMIREYRTSYYLRETDIKSIISRYFSEIGINKYLVPIDNNFIFEKDIYVSRDKDCEFIIKLLDNDNILHVIGKPGTGKSYLTMELSDLLKKNGYNVTKYYFYINNLDNDNITERNNYNRFITTLNYDLQREKGLDISLTNLSLNNIKDSICDDNGKYCIILDGLDHIIREKSDIDLEKLIFEIVSVFSNSNVKVILLSQPIDLSIKNKYEIGNFNLDEVEEFVSNYRSKFNISKDITSSLLFDITLGNPLILKYEIYKYIYTNSLSNERFSSLDEYYNYIFNGLQSHIYSYFGILDFPVNKSELGEISGHSSETIDKEIKAICNILHKNEKEEYSSFHESMKRYIKEKANTEYDVNLNMNNIFNWLNSKDIFSNKKAFLFLPSMTIRLNKYTKFNFNLDYVSFFNAIINNGYVSGDVSSFCKNLTTIYIEKNDYKNLYIISYLYDAYSNFLYEFDMDNFEFYVYMLFYNNEKEKIINIINAKNVDIYSGQFRDYATNISKFLIDNNFNGIDYISFINIFKNSGYFENKNCYFNFNNFIWSYYDGYPLLFKIFKHYNYSLEDALNYIGEKDSILDAAIKSFYLNNSNGYFINCLYDMDIYAEKKDISFNKYLEKLKGVSNIDEDIYYDIILSFLSLSYDDRKKLVYQWDIFDINNNFIYYTLSLFYVLTSSLSNKEINKILDKFVYVDMQFKGLTMYKPILECRMIVRNERCNTIINKLYEIINNQIRKYDFRDYEGIRPYMQSIKNKLPDYIIRGGTKINENTLKLLEQYVGDGQSNSSNFLSLVKNFCLYKLAGIDNSIYNEISKYMFSYGSYRDIQLWEFEDFTDRLILDNLINKEMVEKMVSISLRATSIMDKAKDVHHIPGSVLSKYGETEPFKAIEILFENIYLYGYFEDSDNLFANFYDKIYVNNNKRFNRYYEYWKYIQNVSYKESNQYIRLINLINLFPSIKQKRYILEEFCDSLKNDFSSYTDDEIKLIKEAIINKDITYLNSLVKYDKYDNKKKYNNKKYKDIYELLDDKNRGIKYNDLLLLQIKLLSKVNKDELLNYFLDKEISYYNYDIIHSIIKVSEEQIRKLNKKLFVTYLVCLYSKTCGNVSTMSYDEVMDLAIKIDKDTATYVLKRFISKDKYYDSRMKAGKIIKYLMPKEDLIDVFNTMIDIYSYRLPKFNKLIMNFNLDNFSKEELLFNYIAINNFYNNRLISLEEFIMIKIYNEFKIRNVIYFCHDGARFDTIGEFLGCLNYYFNNNGYLMYETFLKNYGEFKKYDKEVIYESNSNRSRYIVKSNGLNVLNNNLPILIFSNLNDVIKYKCSYSHYYNNGLDSDYINLKKRVFYLKKRNIFSRICLRFKFWKRRILSKYY